VSAQQAITLLAALSAGAAAWLLAARTSPRLKSAIVVGVTVIALIAAVLAIPRADSGDGNGIQSPSSSAASSPPAPSRSSPSTRSPTEVPFDDFNSKLQDDKNWTLSPVYDSDPKQLPKQIYTEGGKLHLKVSPENSPTGANAELKAKFPSEWTITKISVKMTLERQQGKSDGGAYLSISSFEDRENRAWMGPGGDNQDVPMLGYKHCPQFDTGCRNIDQHQIPVGEEYQIEAVATRTPDTRDKRYLNFHVTGHEDWGAYAPPDSGEIRSFRFYLFSDAKRDFHVSVDEVIITYI
jgi:hypothetical protein